MPTSKRNLQYELGGRLYLVDSQQEVGITFIILPKTIHKFTKVCQMGSRRENSYGNKVMV